MQNCEWFKDWFNSPYYHILYKNRNLKEASEFIDKLSAHLHLSKSDLIWDLACGKGRHSLYLNSKGFNVIGTDLSQNSIKAASEKQNERLEFYMHDMRTPFRINYFTHVFNLFTSIGYFESDKDNFKVFKNVHNALRDGGIFVVDFFNVECLTKNIKTEEEKEVEGIKFKISKRIEAKKVFKKIFFDDGIKSGTFEEQVSLLTKEDFLNYAEVSGFKLQETFGDYNLNPFDKNNSERLILIFKK